MIIAELLGLTTPAVYHTAPWRTQNTTSGDCRTAEQNRIPAVTQWTRIQWKFVQQLVQQLYLNGTLPHHVWKIPLLHELELNGPANHSGAYGSWGQAISKA